MFFRIGCAMDKAKIRFARIDGRMKLAERISSMKVLRRTMVVRCSS